MKNKLKNINQGMIIHCKEEHEANELLSKLKAQGYKWVSSRTLSYNNNWSTYKENTIYYIDENISYGDIKLHDGDLNKIIEFKDLKREENIKKFKHNDSNYEVLYDLEKEINTCGVYRILYKSTSKIIRNGKCVIVFLDTGEKGVAKCCDEDEFDLEKGYCIAYYKAFKKRIKNQLRYYNLQNTHVEGMLKILTK